MAQTYGDAWRRVRLHAPAVPTFLAREWVNVAWKRLAKGRHWGFLRGETRLTVNASRSVSGITVTRNSATVTSSTPMFVAGDAGRQFRLSGIPIYTIQTFNSTTSIALDIPYGEDSSTIGVFTIFDGYATMPADFESFRLIADPYNQRRLAYWIQEDEINLMDPTWSVTDTGPRALIARGGGSTYIPTLGAIQYQYWPRPNANRSFPVLYNKQAALLSDTSVIHGVLADHMEVVVDGALAEAAMWPGTNDLKNAYFNPVIAAEKKRAFLEGVQHLSLRDDDQTPDDLATVHWEHWPLADLAFNDKALRSTDATVMDLY